MIKKIILLGSKDAGGKNDVHDMARHLENKLDRVELTTVFLEDLLLNVGTDKQSVVDLQSGRDLKDADLVVAMNWYRGGPKSLYRDVMFAVALYLDKHGVSFWNSEARQQRSISKVSAMMQLSLLGLPVPATLFSLDADHLIHSVKNEPFILKSAIASRGADNFLCQDIHEAKSKLTSKTPNHFMVQEHIENDRDLRIVCFGGEPQLVIERRRTSTDTHLNNTSQGAEAKLEEVESLSSKIVDECRQICYNMGREMAGIDLLPANNSDRYVYLEVNAIPQLTSGSFVDEKMAALAKVLNEQKGTR